ncbi:MAG: cereblon family protein [Thermodesulfobacteriota bacterium]|nr:cereblon family protein [Thermodesulfobacteriota bacterium]
MQRHDPHTAVFTEYSRFAPIAGPLPLMGLKTGPSSSSSVTTGIKTINEKRPEEDDVLLCARCLHPITRPGARTTANGRHVHVFANPGGLVFEIGCFRTAPGCGHAGSPTLEFTWFNGYAWQVATCNGCLEHLGWYYTADGTSFYGLILNRLIDTQQ